MNCDQVERAAYFFLDGTLTQQHLQELTLHLGDCHHCEERIVVHRRLHEFVIHHLPHDTAPDRLKQRLTRTLRAVSADM